MRYKNGKQYSLSFGSCKVNVTLENFRPAVVEKFNQILAQERIKALERSQLQEKRA